MDAPPSLGRSSALLWSAVFAPGLVCVGLGVFVFESTVVIAVGVVLLVAPLAVQMFGPDWDRETIPEGHHHDHRHADSERVDRHDARAPSGDLSAGAEDERGRPRADSATTARGRPRSD